MSGESSGNHYQDLPFDLGRIPDDANAAKHYWNAEKLRLRGMPEYQMLLIDSDERTELIDVLAEDGYLDELPDYQIDLLEMYSDNATQEELEEDTELDDDEGSGVQPAGMEYSELLPGMHQTRHMQIRLLIELWGAWATDRLENGAELEPAERDLLAHIVNQDPILADDDTLIDSFAMWLQYIRVIRFAATNDLTVTQAERQLELSDDDRMPDLFHRS